MPRPGRETLISKWPQQEEEIPSPLLPLAAGLIVRNRECGAILHDEYRGKVRVDGFTDAPIPWPGYTYNRADITALPILTGDLIRAVVRNRR